MKASRARSLTFACVSLMLLPSGAAAETLLIPWLGPNNAGPYSSGAIETGGSVGVTAGGVIGADVELGYSPNFFGNALSSHVLTTMGNVTLGIPFDRTHAGLRPYATGGMGLIRAQIGGAPYGYSISSNDVGINVGGGIMGFFGQHLGIRVDLRYLHSLEDNTSVPSKPVDLSRLHYWRTSFGLVIR
jgi:hypothetical protein